MLSSKPWIIIAICIATHIDYWYRCHCLPTSHCKYINISINSSLDRIVAEFAETSLWSLIIHFAQWTKRTGMHCKYPALNLPCVHRLPSIILLNMMKKHFMLTYPKHTSLFFSFLTRSALCHRSFLYLVVWLWIVADVVRVYPFVRIETGFR